MAEENATRRDWCDGSLDFSHFLSAACRLALVVRRVSEIHGLGGEAQAGLETRGQRELSTEETAESRVEEAESGGRLLRRTVTVRVGGEGGGGGARGTEKEINWISGRKAAE